MSLVGLALLVVAFAASLAAVAGLGARQLAPTCPAVLARCGHVGVVVGFAALLAACGLLVFCFMTGDVSLMYVLEQRSLSTDGFAWLYKLAGLWAGRAGSLLFWTFLVSLFGVLLLARSARTPDDRLRRLDDVAMMCLAVVVAVFSGALLFSDGNMPFEPTSAEFMNPDGTLTPIASAYSMNQLLEHWAMAIHPPLLFVGYAGLTVAFGYGVAALVTGDRSAAWVERATRFVLVSWLFLGAGIGLGAVWAYVVLGWGGYWGWDPVENASLLPWLMCVALVHTYAVFRKRGAFRRWAIACSCLVFTFVMLATFITRSGIVQSVHSFAGDPVSIALFGGLIVVSLAVPAALLALRWRALGPTEEEAADIESMFSRDAAYYFNNVLMLVLTLILAYMTVSSALPAWLPFGGYTLGASAYNAIARPVGILYLLLMAVCPLLAWGKTDPKAFARQACVPGVLALVLFAALVAYWALNLLPVYEQTMAKGDASTIALVESGPAWYYHGLAVAGLLVASLLFFNAAFMLGRALRAPKKRGSSIGGALAHTAMAVMLVGLIGSSMYVSDHSGYLGFDAKTNTADGTYQVAEYELAYAGDSVTDNSKTQGTMVYNLDFDVYKNGQLVGQVHPSVQLDVLTQQRKLNAAVMSFPDEDLFVVYRGVNQQGAFSLDVRVNPFVSFVWLGLAMLLAGTLCAALMPRRAARPGKEARD